MQTAVCFPVPLAALTRKILLDVFPVVELGFNLIYMKNLKDFVASLKKAICDNTYPGFDLGGHPVIIWDTDGYSKIDEMLSIFI